MHLFGCLDDSGFIWVPADSELLAAPVAAGGSSQPLGASENLFIFSGSKLQALFVLWNVELRFGLKIVEDAHGHVCDLKTVGGPSNKGSHA